MLCQILLLLLCLLHIVSSTAVASIEASVTSFAVSSGVVAYHASLQPNDWREAHFKLDDSYIEFPSLESSVDSCQLKNVSTTVIPKEGRRES